MTRAGIQFAAVLFACALLLAAAVGYFAAPARMLSVVGIEATAENSFLIRTLAAAFLGMLPMVWAVRRRGASPSERAVLIGLALYMVAGSAVDLHAYLSGIVGFAAVPSVVLRTLLGLVLAWLAL